MSVRIVSAERADAALVAGVIAEAFAALRVAEWLVDDPAQRQDVLARNMMLHVGHALEHGMVSMTEDGSAVSVWLPVTPGEPEPPDDADDDYDTRLAAACGPWTDRFRALDEAFARHHPHDEPHHHLALLATRPKAQGRGLGSALLRHHHAAHPELPAFLEASSPRSRELYLRHGYTDLGRYSLPGPDAPSMWPMWRPAAHR